MDTTQTTLSDSLEFEVIAKPEGGFVAACTQKKIFVEADDLQSLHDGIQKSVDQAYIKHPAKKPSGKNIRLIVHQLD